MSASLPLTHTSLSAMYDGDAYAYTSYKQTLSPSAPPLPASYQDLDDRSLKALLHDKRIEEFGDNGFPLYDPTFHPSDLASSTTPSAASFVQYVEDEEEALAEPLIDPVTLTAEKWQDEKQILPLPTLRIQKRKRRGKIKTINHTIVSHTLPPMM